MKHDQRVVKGLAEWHQKHDVALGRFFTGAGFIFGPLLVFISLIPSLLTRCPSWLLEVMTLLIAFSLNWVRDFVQAALNAAIVRHQHRRSYLYLDWREILSTASLFQLLMLGAMGIGIPLSYLLPPAYAALRHTHLSVALSNLISLYTVGITAGLFFAGFGLVQARSQRGKGLKLAERSKIDNWLLLLVGTLFILGIAGTLFGIYLIGSLSHPRLAKLWISGLASACSSMWLMSLGPLAMFRSQGGRFPRGRQDWVQFSHMAWISMVMGSVSLSIGPWLQSMLGSRGLSATATFFQIQAYLLLTAPALDMFGMLYGKWRARPSQEHQVLGTYHIRFTNEEIKLPPLIDELMQTRAFRRLQEISQMSFSWLLLPRANHTRHEHSVMTWYMGTRIIKALDLASQISEDGLNRLQAALLLHDVGHYPFSHVLEAVQGLISHEENGLRIILSDPEIGAVLCKYGVNPTRVANLIEPPPGGYQNPEDAFLHTLLSADALGVDVDRMAHILLDAWLLGIPAAEWLDSEKLIQSLRVHPNVYGMERGIVITPEGVEPLQDLLNLRARNRKRISAEAACAAKVMAVNATEEALNSGALRQKRLVGLTDDGLLAVLRKPGMPQVSRNLARRLSSGKTADLYQAALTVGPRDQLFEALEPFRKDKLRLRDLESRLAEMLGCPVLMDIPGPISKGQISMQVLEQDGSLTLWRDLALNRKDDSEVRMIRVFVTPEAAARLSHVRMQETLDRALLAMHGHSA